jgi:hypothetical protein
MHVRAMLQQQAQTANQSNQTSQRTTERPQRPERRERPERPERPEQAERPESPDVASGPNQVIVRVPAVPAVPAFPGGITVSTGEPANMIPPQVVDLAYGFFFMVAAMVIGWPLSRAFGRRLERSGQHGAISPAVSEQLQRIEQAVEAMALEVERISEAQRYFTKLQTGQVAEPAALPTGDPR